MKKISVIVPVYNAEKYIRETLDSLKAQTMGDIEILMVDDGSQDGSPAICDEYANSDARFHVIHQSNGGVSVARNRGIRETGGEWITFVDADDQLTPEALERLYAMTDGETDLVMGSVMKFGDVPDEVIATVTGKSRDVFGKILNPAPWGQLFRRSIITDHQLAFQENLAYSEDTLFVFAYRQFVREYATVEDVVYRYRICADSATFSPNLMKRSTHHMLASYEFQRLAKQQTDPKAIAILENIRNYLAMLALQEMMQSPDKENIEKALRRQFDDTFVKNDIAFASFDILLQQLNAQKK